MIKVGLTQMDIVWEDKEQNQKTAERLMKQAVEQGVDLLVFPEMTLTGFTMNTECASEDMAHSASLAFFRKKSLELHLAVIFGLVIKEEGKCYNRLVCVSEGEVCYTYDKIHPFSYGEESQHYIGGDKVSVGRMKEMNLSGFVCYDLRFPEIFQAVADRVEVIFVIANWPKERLLHWETLLPARAVENQCYVVGVNRTGSGNGEEYVPSSVAFSPLGERLTKAGDTAELLIVELDVNQVKRVREQFPFRQDRREELYREIRL